MKHVASISLNGFQSHIGTQIKLCPGLNVITGASDSGKTAVIRSIRWGLYNEPLGEEFINPSIGKAEATLEFSDGIILTRTRGKGENSYAIEKGDASQEYKGFGTNIPEEVTHAHSMQKASFGDVVTSLNMSFQLDAPFMLSETPGAAAKVLGKLAGTEELDLAAKDVNGDLFKERQKKTSLEALIEKTQNSISDYVWVEDAEQKLQRLEDLISQTKEKEIRDISLVKFADKMVDLDIEFEKVTLQIQKYKNLISGQNKIQVLERITTNYFSMAALMRTHSSLIDEGIDNKIILKGLKKLDKVIALDAKLCEIASKLPQLKNLDRKLTEINKSFWVQKSIVVKTKNLDTARRMLILALDKNDSVTSFLSIRAKVEYFAGRIEGGGKFLDKFKNLEKVEQILLGTNTKLIVLDELEDCSNKFSDKSIKIKDIPKDIEYYENQEQLIKTSFSDYLKSLGKCPTCHTDIEDLQIQNITGGI